MTAMAQALSKALLDFVWQGLLMGFLLWTMLFVLRNRSARARYAASCLILAAMAVLPVVTTWLAYRSPGLPQIGGAAIGAQVARAGVTTAEPVFHWTAWFDRWALPVWFAGVLFFSLRLAWASRRIAALRRQSQAPDTAVLGMLADLRERMKLSRPVRLLVTVAAECPSVVGWLRPVVLLPASTIVGLTPAQLEAVLAHELAHILRYDYLVNMLQSVVETLLFYHPAVWWASGRIRQERELCCDDLAVAASGDALSYARALTRLERLRLMPGLALSSTGGPLFYRIRRIVGEAGPGDAPSKLPGILALVLGLLCLSLNMQRAGAQQHDVTSSELSIVVSDMQDDAGVRVDPGGATVLHREGVEYPEAARQKGIQGTVVLEATLDAEGAVSDARVLSGPAELRKAALESVLQWHFAAEAAGSTRQISIVFEPPREGSAGRIRGGIGAGVGRGIRGGIGGGISGGIGGGIGEGVSVGGLERQIEAGQDRQSAQILEDLEARAREMAQVQAELAGKAESDQARMADSLLDSARSPQGAKVLQEQLEVLRKRQDELASASSDFLDDQAARQLELQAKLAELQGGLHFRAANMQGYVVKSIEVRGLNGAPLDELLAKLPVHAGDTIAEDTLDKLAASVGEFDSHMHLYISTTGDRQVVIRITTGSATLAHP